MVASVTSILEKYNKDKTRLMDILLEIQEAFGYISSEAVNEIARCCNISTVDVQQTISFYHFFTQKPTGKYTVYLNNSVVANMMGREQIKETFERETGTKFGQVSEDGLFGLFDTSCIGMNDQEPSAIINGKVFTNLTPFRVKELVRGMREGKDVEELMVEGYGDGNNGNKLVRSMVMNNIRRKGPILDDNYTPGIVIWKKLPTMTPEQVIAEVKASNIKGRGGAGFPTGLKWEFCRRAKGDRKFIFCNADEGEPGTFKDRVILTERPKLLFEGMVIAAYAVGATEGILYVRHEYKYLQKHLESILQGARERNLLGKDIGGIKGFNFDIRIQFGAGAYVCGEESALIESAEGKRGEPRDRPPFPVEKGYLDYPTVVNNVETLCAVVKVMLNGGEWYRSFGTQDSTGTKLLSVSGDCKYPGVYEVEWGFSVYDILGMVGATPDVQAVQVGGPSGTLLAPVEFRRILGYEDLATGGSIIIFGKHRDLLKDVVLNFTEFFIDESCGSCSTCRIMPVVLRNKLLKILNGKGVIKDIDDMLEWAKVLKASRCGLGQTAANPIVSSIKNFRHLYEQRVRMDTDFDSGFNLAESVKDYIEAS
ncbi:MAG TPA: NAD(P)H-dependent oxidoreductase subunit E, partial [Bacteroidales bacterium]|nr:NAD(P)H-dependent oxidoreductase subunit E [Bacteroidales bacterium]